MASLCDGGAVGMQDPANGRYKAFLIVGLMYFLVAVLAPAAMLLINGQSLNVFTYPQGALAWASVAGILGAVGAFGVLLAFGAKGNPAVRHVDRFRRCSGDQRDRGP